jgi:hypothetical protein
MMNNCIRHFPGVKVEKYWINNYYSSGFYQVRKLCWSWNNGTLGIKCLFDEPTGNREGPPSHWQQTKINIISALCFPKKPIEVFI